MKSFSFRLEKVLNLRVHAEDEAGIELGRAVSMLEDIERQLAANAVERDRAVSGRFDRINIAIDGVETARLYDSYIERLDSEAGHLRQAALKAAEDVENARAAYIERSAERKTIDKLREKRYTEYRKERLTEDENQIEDSQRGRG
jgi:flagellar FliJ protein